MEYSITCSDERWRSFQIHCSNLEFEGEEIIKNVGHLWVLRNVDDIMWL